MVNPPVVPRAQSRASRWRYSLFIFIDLKAQLFRHNNQIIRSFSSNQNVNVSVSSSLPSGYSFSYWQLKSPTTGSQSTSIPFNQELIGSGTNPTPALSNQTITEIDLVFSYTAPITSSTFTYSGGETYYSGGYSGGGGMSSGGGFYQSFQ